MSLFQIVRNIVAYNLKSIYTFSGTFNDNGILDGVFPASTNFGTILSNFSNNITVSDCVFEGSFGSDFATAFIPVNTNNTIMYVASPLSGSNRKRANAF